MARDNGEACVQIFFIRGGKLIGREYFILEGTEDEADSEVMAEFIKQFYAEAANVPPQVLLPNEMEEAQIIQEWLNTRRGGAQGGVAGAARGQPARNWSQMAAENAAETLRGAQGPVGGGHQPPDPGAGELQQALELPEPPNRIECYDISNTQGTAAVGSMVVFEQGVPSKKLYRHFNIQTVQRPGRFRQHGGGAHPPLPALAGCPGREDRRSPRQASRTPVLQPRCPTC